METEQNIEQLRLLSLSLLNSVESLKPRHIVSELNATLKRAPRIKLLRGFRGVGKTTAMLHVFGENKDKAIYFSADNPLIKQHGIYNTARSAVKRGFVIILIDEIHTYPEWRGELKALNDEFPAIFIIASGSAPLALVPERREELICLHEMNLLEMIMLKKGDAGAAQEEWKDKEKTINFIATAKSIEADFQAYMRTGGFPLSLALEQNLALDAIFYSIKKSVREDAVYFLKMSKEKVFAMENLLNFLASSKPGELSITSLSSTLHISKTTVYEIIDALEGMEIIRVIRPYAKGAALVRAEPKLLFFHPNMRFAVCKQLGLNPEIGSVREELAVFGFSECGWTIHTVRGEKKSPDYVIEKNGETNVVEIGGERKGKAQLKGFKNRLVVSEYQLIPLLMVAKSAKND